MRSLAFGFLLTAAFDWPLPWLDRAGTALVGVAFLGLAVMPGGWLRARRARMSLPPKQVTLPDATDAQVSDLVASLLPYSASEEQGVRGEMRETLRRYIESAPFPDPD